MNQDQQRSNTEDENDDDDEDERESQKEKLSLPHVLKIGYIILMEPLFDYEKRVQTGKEMLARVVAMLTRLIDRFDTDNTRNRGS